MANEITILSQRPGTEEYEVLMLFPVTPIDFGTGPLEVAMTPSSTLPEVAKAVLTAQELAKLDEGTMIFYVVRVSPDGMTNPQVLDHVRRMYARKAETITANRDTRYGGRVGQRFDAV